MLTRRLSTMFLAAGVFVGYLAATAASALAMPKPQPDDSYTGAPPVHTVVNTTGTPIWVFVLVALVAAGLTLAANLLVTRWPRPHTNIATA
jgi:hypothetical protein